MTEDELRIGPDGLTALVMGVMGAVWVCISASGIGWGHCVMLVLCIAAAMIVRAKHPSWWPYFALGLALYAPILAGAIYFGIHEAWDFPLATNSCGHRWVFSPATLWVHGLLVLAVVGLAASYLCLLAARYLVGNAQFLVSTLRFGGIAMFAFTIASFAWAMMRNAQKPNPEQYIESLPVLGVVPPAEGPPARILEERDISQTIYPTYVYEFPLTSNIIARRYLSNHAGCSFLLRSADAPTDGDDRVLRRPPAIMTGMTSPWMCNDGYAKVDEKVPIVIREDKTHGLLFADGQELRAIDKETFQFRALSIRDILDTTSIPRGWLVAAIAGLFVMVILQVIRYRGQSRLRRIADARVGMVATDGLLVLDDGSPPIRIGPETPISPGPVIVLRLDSQTVAGGPYRRTFSTDNLEVLPGERNDVLHRERWALQTSFDAIVIAILVLAAIPLVTLGLG